MTVPGGPLPFRYVRRVALLTVLAVVSTSCWWSDGVSGDEAPSTSKETASLSPGEATTLEIQDFRLHVPADAISTSGTISVSRVEKAPVVNALRDADLPAEPAGDAVMVETDAELTGPSELTWRVDEATADAPVASLRRRHDGTSEVVGVTRHGDTVTVATRRFSMWVPLRFSPDLVRDWAGGVFDAFEAERVAPVAEPSCPESDLSGYNFSSPDNGRLRWCVSRDDHGRLALVARNNRAGAAKIEWAATEGSSMELIDRDDQEISLGRGGRALLEALEERKGIGVAYAPRGAEMAFRADLEPGQGTALRSSVAGEALLIDALTLGIDVYLATLRMIAGDEPVTRAQQMLDSADMVGCLTDVASNLSVAENRRDVFASGVKLVGRCLEDQLEEVVGGAIGTAVAGVFSMAITAVAALATSAEDIYDIATGQDQYDIGITAEQQPLTNSTPIDIRGAGAVEAGMTVREAEARTGQPFKITAFETFDHYCYYTRPRGVSDYAFMVQSPSPDDVVDDPRNGEIVRIEVRGGAGAQTLSGLSPGDPREKVESTYRNLKAKPHLYEPDGVNLYLFGSNEDDGFGVRFEVGDTGTVGGIYAGKRRAIQLAEGCV